MISLFATCNGVFLNMVSIVNGDCRAGNSRRVISLDATPAQAAYHQFVIALLAEDIAPWLIKALTKTS